MNDAPYIESDECRAVRVALKYSSDEDYAWLVRHITSMEQSLRFLYEHIARSDDSATHIARVERELAKLRVRLDEYKANG